MNSEHPSFLVSPLFVLSEAQRRGLGVPAVIWDDECSSTNDELARLVRDGEDPESQAAHPDTVVALSSADRPSAGTGPEELTIRGTDFQTAGHGRLGRTWTVPPRKSLTFSVLLTPGRVFDSWGWIPLITGEAVRAAIAEAGVPACLKWPNDVLTEDGRKLCGILARIETLESGPRIILGMGINTRLELSDLPRETASSLAIEKGVPGSAIDHEQLLLSILERLIPAYQELIEHGDEDFGSSETAAQVKAGMVTLGTRVRIERPDGGSFVGLATGVDSGGDLIIDDSIHISAGDVHHLRPAR